MVFHTWHPAKIVLALVILLWFWIAYIRSSLLWMFFSIPMLIVLWIWFSNGGWAPPPSRPPFPQPREWRRKLAKRLANSKPGRSGSRNKTFRGPG